MAAGDDLNTNQSSIDAYTSKGIARVNDASIRLAIEDAYRSPSALALLSTAHDVFGRLTESQWPKDVLSTFFSGWRAMHGTALFVSGLMIRLQRESRGADSSAKALLAAAAGEIGEIIAEDTGVDDTPHAELFSRFATTVVGDDRWQSNQFSLPACQQFRNYVRVARLSGPIEEAILTTAASESWNSGEYSFLNTRVRQWLRILGHPVVDVESAIEYVSHHSGDVELGHFLHALNGWIFYCQAIGRVADPHMVGQVFDSYFTQLGKAFEELRRIF